MKKLFVALLADYQQVETPIDHLALDKHISLQIVISDLGNHRKLCQPFLLIHWNNIKVSKFKFQNWHCLATIDSNVLSCLKGTAAATYFHQDFHQI